MTGNGLVEWSETLSGTRAQAAIEARRFGVPHTMIEAATQRRLAGDWRGACAVADVDFHLNPDAVRRRHGAHVAGQLLTDLRSLAPDLLRWHLPRRGHGAGHLLEGLLVPLADYAAAGAMLTLAVATPRFALDAGQRIVLILLENGRVSNGCVSNGCVSNGRVSNGCVSNDCVSRALLDGVRRRSAGRYSLRRHRMFWDAACAPQLHRLCAGLCHATGADGFEDVASAREITRLQDAGQAAAAWAAAGIHVAVGRQRRADRDQQGRLTRWLATIPVNLPLLIRQVRETLPGAGRAVIRSGGGAIVLRGLDGPDGAISAEVAPSGAGRGLPVVPEAAWVRPVDADLLRFRLLQPLQVHPLVAAALAPGVRAARADQGTDEWLYATVPGIEAPCGHGPGSAAVLVRCGSQLHRVRRLDGRWQAVDHQHLAREALLARLGGPANPCQRAAEYLSTGQHVVDVVEPLMEHGRVGEALYMLRKHADASAAPESFVLPGGGTVGEALSSLHENTLRLRMVLAGASPARDTPSARRPVPNRRHSRKGEPARHHR